MLVTSNCLDEAETLQQGVDRGMRFAPLLYAGSVLQ